MGNMYTAYIKSPDTTPNHKAPPTFDPLYGFPHGRQERKMQVTEEEMEAAGLIGEERDYCAHLLIDFFKCRKQKFPYVAACKHEKHVWESCQYEDFVLRMKEYERERRLLERRKRKGGVGSEVMVE
jgi:NADH dehydrogenase (ubiquinone) 1 beta subcomplex subunit 7